MADPVMGALVRLIPKLYQLLSEEYNLPTSTKERIRSITLELQAAQAALSKVSQVPWDHLDEQIQIWAREVRESTCDMEDILEAFLVRVHQAPDSTEKESKQPLKKVISIWKKRKARLKIGVDVKNIMKHLEEATERCRRYKVHDIAVIKPATTSTVDNRRLHAMYKKANKVVGIDKSREELISKLQSLQPNHALSSNVNMKIVSVVGVAGLGKTTLAKAVYDKLKGHYDCWAFVPVGRIPDLTKVFKDILIDLDKQRYLQFSTAVLDERQLIDELHSFLKNKRYFIVIDDLWEIQPWETIKLAIDGDNNSGGRIIITTRNLDVAKIAGDVYNLQPLPYDKSRELFFTTIYGHEGKFGGNWSDDITDEFIRKCDGIPLAIITMASLLVGKRREEWYELYKTIDFCRRGNKETEHAMMILSSSYKDLPSHLRFCLLYLSGFPEDYVIPKDSLIWKWVAEGFIVDNQESRLFEIGEGYFNDLISRSMIQAVESEYHENIITGCRVPIMVLHFIRSMCREESFFTIVDDNQDTLLHSNSNVRRLANHNRTIGHTHQTNHIEMPKLRSFTALGCAIEMWAPHSSFTLLRVVAIENCNPMDGCHRVRVEHLGDLLHLRFLSLRGTRTEKIPKKIGDLKFLQMLDLWESNILELPSSNRLPSQMLCLRITFDDAFDAEVPLLETLTSLEELAITGGPYLKVARRWLEDLGSLLGLRVLHASGILFVDEETERTFGESLRHLHKLQHLTIIGYDSDYQPRWKSTEFVLPRHLQHLAVYNVLFSELPSCIDPSCLGNLSHLNLKVEYMDEYDLKILGLLPELSFLELELWSSITITNFSDSDDTVYFSKLRCCRLTRSMVFFCENEADRTVSFHIDIDDSESDHGDDSESEIDCSSDDGFESESGDEHSGPMISISDDELQRPGPSMYEDDLYEDDELQIPTASVSDEDLNIPPPIQHSKLQYGLAAIAYYLLAFFQYILGFVKKWPSKQVVEHPPISCLGYSHGNGEDPIAMTSTISSDENKSSICGNSTEAPRFMPTLQVLGFQVSVRTMPKREDHRYCDNLGLEYLSSLRKIEVCILPLPRDIWGCQRDLEAALRRAVQVHPNRPTLHFI